MESFEDIVSELSDLRYTAVDVKLAFDASICSGFLHHESACECDNRAIVICFKLHGENKEDVNIAVLPGTPLWEALVDGRFHAKIQQRVSETT
jgi:hypothetical protein